MSKITSTLRHAADLLEVAIETLTAISKLTKTTKDDQAVLALQAIAAIVSTASAGFTGQVTPDEIRAHTTKLVQQLQDNAAAVAQALHDRFDQG